MKGKCLIFIALFFIGVSAFAQRKVTLGVKSGVHRSWLDRESSMAYGRNFSNRVDNLNNDDLNEDFKSTAITSYSGGLYGAYQFSDAFFVQLEALYMRYGFENDFSISHEGQEYVANDTYTYDMINIPLLLGVEKDLYMFKAFIYGGPAMSINLSGTRKYQVQSNSFSNGLQLAANDFFTNDIETDVSDDNRFTYYLVIGGGLKYFTSENFFISLDARYNGPVTSIRDIPFSAEEDEIMLQGFSALLGVGFLVGDDDAIEPIR